MTTPATTSQQGDRATGDTSSALGLTMPRVIRSEWIKVRSVRSTVITFALAAVAVVAFGMLVSMLSSGGAGSTGDNGPASSDPISASLAGVNLAQLALGVLGALFITSEYSTGLIRATLATVPKRLPVLWAKALVIAGATFATMGVAVVVAFLAGQAVYGGAEPGASLFDPGVPRALLGAAMLPTAIAVMGVALGVLLRSTAAAVGLLVAMLFIVPLLLELFGGVGADAAVYLPSEAGQAMSALVHESGELSPLAGLGVLAAWVGGLLAAAAFALTHRDV
jgi:hypothetical protein